MGDITYANEVELSKQDQKLVDGEWQKADKSHYGQVYKTYQELSITARHNNQLAGRAKLSIEGGVVWLEELIVFEEFRRQGTGTELMQKTIDEAKKRKCHKIILETNQAWPAYDLYKKFGFEIEATLVNHYANQDHIIMSKFLD